MWYGASREPLSSVADRSYRDNSTQNFSSRLKAIMQCLVPINIFWPYGDSINEVANGFLKDKEGVIGAINNLHI